MFFGFEKKCFFVLWLCLAGSILCVQPATSQENSGLTDQNPDWKNRLGPGDLMDVATKWVSKQHQRLHVNENTNLRFEPLTVSRDQFGMAHLRFRPIIKNIPVIGKEIILHTDDATRTVLSVQGFLDVEESVNTLPTINQEQALAELAKEGINPGQLQKTELVLFAVTRNESRLAWSFDVKYSDEPGSDLHVLIYMDAHTGSILARHPQFNFGVAGIPFSSPLTIPFQTAPVTEEKLSLQIFRINSELNGGTSEPVNPTRKSARNEIDGNTTLYLSALSASENFEVKMRFVDQVIDITDKCTIVQSNFEGLYTIAVHFNTTDLPPATGATFIVKGLPGPIAVTKYTQARDSIWIPIKSPLATMPQRFLFDVYYENHAGAYTLTGVYIDNRGYVYRYDHSDTVWLPDALTEAELMEKFRNPGKFLGVVDTATLQEMVSLIGPASLGPFSDPANKANDMGAQIFAAYQYDQQTGTYSKVLLRESGDWLQQNLSPAASILYEWLTKVTGARDLTPPVIIEQ